MTLIDTSRTAPHTVNTQDHVVVWVQANCRQCWATKRFLDRAEVPYEVRDVDDDVITAVKEAKAELRAPVVRFRDDLWSGFRPDKLSEAVALLAAA